jgi:hypothetical protein
MRERLRAVLVTAAVAAVCLPATVLAQTGSIAGTVRDVSGAVMPGVTVEVTSPQLIERTRSAVTDANGRYQITSLPVGVYKVSFALDGFQTFERSNIELSTDFTAPVNAEMKVGARAEKVTVIATASLIDVQNARQRQVFTGDEVADLPTTRNLGDLIQLVPGIGISAAGFSGNSVPTICSGNQGDGAFSGALSGCGPILDGFNAHSSINDPDSINQGRMQVNGMGIQSFGGGGRTSYIVDVGNAQEISLSLSGALGESETGGATINVIPRTGGNRFAGNYFTAYSNSNFYDRNDGTHTTNFQNRLIREYDVNGAYGGPIKRDRLWFYSVARRQDRASRLFSNFRNLNEGVFGANYKWDPTRQMQQSDIYQNANARITWQVTRRDKLNLFWDEQYTCENPCKGADAATSLEASDSNLSRPLRVMQANWTNPFTNRILLEAGYSQYHSHRNETKQLLTDAYPQIPRIVESGVNIDVAPGGCANPQCTITSGSINNAIDWLINNVQTNAAASYITGSHNIKVGYQGQYLSRLSNPYFNDLRLQYGYATPASTCTSTPAVVTATGTASTWCGLFPDGRRAFDGRSANQPLGPALDNSLRPPVPSSVTQYIPSGSDESGWFTAFYAQDQWTWKRFTLNGALRYDNAKSHFGKTCVGPDLYTPFQYCLNDPANGDSGKGVDFNDITPRWGVAWDLFGTGKTSVKYSMGKYLQGSNINIGSREIASNPASGGRTVNAYTRVWKDLDGDRVVDCDLVIPGVAPTTGLPNTGECGGPAGTSTTTTARRFGRSPDALDELGLAIGLNTIYCGQDEPSMSPQIRAYCNNYFAAGGSSLLEGWNKRQYEWQFSLGVQHEILRGLSGEVTYNRRAKHNVTASDLIGSGCDLYSTTEGGTVDAQQCMQDLLNYKSPFYDFYSIRAPADPRLPGGGGYLVEGFATQKLGVTVPTSALTAVTIAPDGSTFDNWAGIDTNFVYRGPHGLRVSGGTSTGRRDTANCGLLLSDPPTGQILREGRERSCDRLRPWQTNVRGTASYTIPWIDVLLSSTFSVRPGTQTNATYTVNIVEDLIWGPNSQNRIGTTLVNNSNTTLSQALLSDDTFGERITLFDMKIAKNFRFKNKRINVGADLFNIFNSDAALGYCATFPNPARGIEGCGSTAAGTLQEWNTVTSIVTPRYARFEIRADF